MTLTCPTCARELTVDADAMVRCECGFQAFAGYLQEYQYLTARRTWLRDRLDEGAGPPDPTVAKAYGVWSVPVHHRPTPSTSPQTLLVTLGAGLLIVAAIVFVAVAWEFIGPWGQIGALLALTAVTTAAAILTRRRAHRTAEALAAVSLAMGLICAIAAPTLGALPTSWSEPQMPYLLIVFGAAVAWGVLLGHRFGLRMWTWLGWLLVPSLLAAVLALTLQKVDGDHVLVTIFGVAYLALGVTLVQFARPSYPWPQRTAGVICLAVAAGFTAVALSFDPPAGAALVMAAALLAAILVGVPWAAWPLAGLLLATLGLTLPETALMAAAAGVAGTILLFAAARTSIPLAAVSAGILWSISFIGTDTQPQNVLAGVAGLGLLAFSMVRGAAPLAWFSAALLWFTYLRTIGGAARFFEQELLVLAALLLVAGLIARRDGSRHSAIVYGPAISVALIPPALLSWFDVWEQEALIRFGIVMVAGTALLILGARRHMLGLVVPATTAIVITATAQIYTTLSLFPRWLALAFAGALLIAIGARLEWVRERGRDTEEWFQTLR
ncbi:MAG: hypothetical protein V9E82_07135 [Candidatus Nanopelagicales bacterium]